MSAKPFPCAKLTVGKSIYGIRNFCATWNWLVDFCSNLKFEKETGLKLDTSISDHPKVVKDEESDDPEEIEIVVPPISYDPGTHSMTYGVKKIKAIVVENSESTRTAFTAVPAYEG